MPRTSSMCVEEVVQAEKPLLVHVGGLGAVPPHHGQSARHVHVTWVVWWRRGAAPHAGAGAVLLCVCVRCAPRSRSHAHAHHHLASRTTQAAADRAPPSLVPYLRKAAPFLAALAVAVNKVAPVFISIYSTAFTYFNMLPYELMMVVFGLALCFFGGVYPAAIAAAEVSTMPTVQSSHRLLPLVQRRCEVRP